ncbi:Tol-Pal system beta propeller repeat protein TolB [Deltaproteobacteria bacterium]|nr:Tol-Pal system beta propeller repeat protein TolB [Deltaproteobacteria bacterium]
MKSLRSTLILKTWKTPSLKCLLGFLLIAQLVLPAEGFGRIFIDINSPSIQKIRIAIPDFKNFSDPEEYPELSAALTGVISNDLDLSGYFIPMDKDSFLDDDGPLLTPENIRFRNWSVIGTEVLLKGGYTCIGRNIVVEIRLYDAFWGRQILGKRFLGKIDTYRTLMHSIGNEILFTLTGYDGMFLSKFAFVNNSTGNKEIYLCDFDGHNVEPITSDKSITLLPRWSPGGESIVYNSYKDGGLMLYIKEISSGEERKLSGREGLNTGACWQTDGEKLALTLSHSGNPDIYSIDLNGKIIERLTDHWGIDISPSFSPDGTKMAFVSNRSGSPQIYVKDLQKGTEERLTFELNYCTSPAWSSSNKIAFSGMSNGHFDIYTINPDGSNLRRLTQNNSNNEDPCWSPDSRYLAFSSNRENGYHLYIMNSNGQNQRRVSFINGEDTSPSWSLF